MVANKTRRQIKPANNVLVLWRITWNTVAFTEKKNTVHKTTVRHVFKHEVLQLELVTNTEIKNGYFSEYLTLALCKVWYNSSYHQ